MNKEQLQENQYLYPYHWGFSPDEYAGREYYGYINFLLRLFDYKKTNVLDAGCGDGRFSALLNTKCASVTALDYSERVISMARILEPKVNFLVEDVHDFSLSNKFDFIFLVEVIEHIDPSRIEEVLNTMKKHLTKNGRIIITVPSDNVPLNIKHYQHFNMDKIDALAKKSNLRLVDLKLLGFSNKIMNFMYKLLDNRYYMLKNLSKYFNINIYPRHLEQQDIVNAERFVIILDDNS